MSAKATWCHIAYIGNGPGTWGDVTPKPSVNEHGTAKEGVCDPSVEFPPRVDPST